MPKTTKELNDYEVTSTSKFDLNSKWYSEEEVEEIKKEIEKDYEIIEDKYGQKFVVIKKYNVIKTFMNFGVKDKTDKR